MLNFIKKNVMNGDSLSYLQPLMIGENRDAYSKFLDKKNSWPDIVPDILDDFVYDYCHGQIPDYYPLVDDHEMMIDMFAHEVAQDVGYYAKITHEVAQALQDQLPEDSVLLDVMAGRGYFVKAMREAGVSTIGTDDYSWHGKQNDQVEKIDALRSIQKYGDHVTHVILSWPPSGDTIDADIIALLHRDYPQIDVIYIGEDNGGCTGSEQLWDTLKEYDYESFYLNVSYRTSNYLHDNFKYFTKNSDRYFDYFSF